MRTVVSLAATLLVTSVSVAACTQPVEATGASVQAEPLTAVARCAAISTGPIDGILVRFPVPTSTTNPVPAPVSRTAAVRPETAWECPTLDGMPGSLSATYIFHWKHMLTTCACATIDELLALQFASEWNDPDVAAGVVPYCMWFLPVGETYAQLAAEAQRLPGAVEQWPLFEAEGGGECTTAYPGGSTCPACWRGPG